MADFLGKVFQITRVVILVLVTLFSEFVLVIGVLVMDSDLRGVYSAFAIGISILTLLIIPVMIFLSTNRNGAFPSMIVVELSYIGVLWVLWLAVAGTIGNTYLLPACLEFSSEYKPLCMKIEAMAAFSILTWLLLMAHHFFLLSLAIMQAQRGNSDIWTSYVTDVNYSAPAAAAAATTFFDSTTEAKAAYGPETPTSPVSSHFPQPASPQQTYHPPHPMVAQV